MQAPIPYGWAFDAGDTSGSENGGLRFTVGISLVIYSQQMSYRYPRIIGSI